MFYFTLFHSYFIGGEYRSAAKSTRAQSCDCPDFRYLGKNLLENKGHIRLKSKEFKGFAGLMLCKFKSPGIPRKEENIEFWTGISIDIDEDLGRPDMQGLEHVIFTTCSSVKEAERLRVLVPLRDPIKDSREYRWAAMELAQKLGITPDPCSFKPNQIYFWPETIHPDDAWIRYEPGVPFEPSKKPIGEDFPKISGGSRTSQNKPGIIQAFNSLYSVEDILNECLGDVYECSGPSLYRLISSESPAGVHVYPDGTAFSFHSTDPVFEGRSMNAFDLWCRSIEFKFGTPFRYPQNKEQISRYIREHMPEVIERQQEILIKSNFQEVKE